MKFALVLLVLVPLAIAAPQKRLLIGKFDTLLEGTELTTLLCGIEQKLGSDATEAACEAECGVLIRGDNLLRHGCPLICKSFQSLIHRFHITKTGTCATVTVPPTTA